MLFCTIFVSDMLSEQRLVRPVVGVYMFGCPWLLSPIRHGVRRVADINISIFPIPTAHLAPLYGSSPHACSLLFPPILHNKRLCLLSAYIRHVPIRLFPAFSVDGVRRLADINISIFPIPTAHLAPLYASSLHACSLLFPPILHAVRLCPLSSYTRFVPKRFFFAFPLIRRGVRRVADINISIFPIPTAHLAPLYGSSLHACSLLFPPILSWCKALPTWCPYTIRP